VTRSRRCSLLRAFPRQASRESSREAARAAPGGQSRCATTMSRGTEPDEAPLDRTVELLEERFRPLAILLFGSRVRGREHAGSDHDLAILTGRPLPDAFAVAAAKADLEDLLGADVDLVVLGAASPILAMEILRDHAILQMRDREAFERFTVRALGAYFDLKQVRAPIEAAILRSDGVVR